MHKYIKSPAQVAALRAICGAWRTEFGFWSFDEVLKIVGRPGSLVNYVALEQPLGAEAVAWAGAILCNIEADAAEILYIYVVPEARRQGLGRRLLEDLIVRLKNLPQLNSLFLEVRVTNTRAIELYESLGMKRLSVRKRYYSDGEDALVFRLYLH